MLPKNQRLKRKTDIDRVFKDGQTVRQPHIICKFRQNELGLTRPCFTIARNLKLNAVKKNRLRRQLTNAFKKAIFDSGTQPAAKDTVFILTQIPTEQSKRFHLFYTEISQCLKNF